ncbi:OLC1v1038029C1 [Oldenlandia corymbosa var. corymbosa]|uniref:OLC1v1038029C1 n=1 Tax=Oldenlandia corymbosa var. corymbosa TaxID=529605 RepID=A0AAV1CYZ3_OLDCO|nr:OLC1v1038029C1 [Oldenlandia corymbosa var. corymbosa]
MARGGFATNTDSVTVSRSFPSASTDKDHDYLGKVKECTLLDTIGGEANQKVKECTMLDTMECETTELVANGKAAK